MHVLYVHEAPIMISN